MSKLQDNPEKEVPKRVLVLALAGSVLIFVLSLFVDFSVPWVVAFFWLGAVSNLICFRLIVVGTRKILEQREVGTSASILPNAILRYAIYIAVLVLALQFGMTTFIATVMGTLLVNLSIKLDGFFGK